MIIPPFVHYVDGDQEYWKKVRGAAQAIGRGSTPTPEFPDLLTIGTGTTEEDFKAEAFCFRQFPTFDGFGGVFGNTPFLFRWLSELPGEDETGYLALCQWHINARNAREGFLPPLELLRENLEQAHQTKIKREMQIYTIPKLAALWDTTPHTLQPQYRKYRKFLCPKGKAIEKKWAVLNYEEAKSFHNWLVEFGRLKTKPGQYIKKITTMRNIATDGQ